MRNEKIESLLAREKALKQAIKQAIKDEVRHAKRRKQKALFIAVQRAGFLDLSDDELEAALKAYHTARDHAGEPEA